MPLWNDYIVRCVLYGWVLLRSTLREDTHIEGGVDNSTMMMMMFRPPDPYLDTQCPYDYLVELLLPVQLIGLCLCSAVLVTLWKLLLCDHRRATKAVVQPVVVVATEPAAAARLVLYGAAQPNKEQRCSESTNASGGDGDGTDSVDTGVPTIKSSETVAKKPQPASRQRARRTPRPAEESSGAQLQRTLSPSHHDDDDNDDDHKEEDEKEEAPASDGSDWTLVCRKKTHPRTRTSSPRWQPAVTQPVESPILCLQGDSYRSNYRSADRTAERDATTLSGTGGPGQLERRVCDASRLDSAIAVPAGRPNDVLTPTTRVGLWSLQLNSAAPDEAHTTHTQDERDAIQKKTFTKWVNKHLAKANRRVDDLFEDLKDGHSLLSLLEVLSGEFLPREKGRMRFHQLQNVETVLNFLRAKNVKTVNIRPEDIVDGNPKLTLGLIWTIILHFQISDITFNQNNEVLTSREALLRWAQRTTQGYPSVKVRDFTSSWKDGLAFNAIIHRNRPDLIDWHSLSRHTVRENLENVFNVAERELGVTRLLDPEDVDTTHPDEKSLITYLSSLYTVFPEPATRNPFEDEKQRVIDEYRDLSSSLLLWLKQNVPRLQSRSFPDRVEDVKQLYQDNAAFRTIEMPPRLTEKQRLQSLWRDMQKLMRENRVQMEDQLRYDYLDTQWKKMLHAHEDRDRALQDEIARLEKLERLAEKVQREVRTTDGKLDDIEARIREVEKDLPRLRPEDAKRTCEVFERDLRRIEETIRMLIKDVQVLMDGRYYRSRELHKLVQNLQQKWENVRISYERRLIDALNNRQYKVEEKKVVKERQVFSESRLLETNDAFRFLQQCLDWVKEKMKHLEEADYGNDLPSIQSLVSQHKTEQKLIDQFQKNIDTCISRKKHFQGQELDFYARLLAQLERGYSDVVVLSNKRMSDLDTLLEFVRRAHEEMMWLNEREEAEISRDWAAANINLVELEAHQGALCHQMEGRESQFNSVLDQGNSLIRQRHPAHKVIDHFLSAMHLSWSWMVELIHALQIHLRHSQDYQQFFREAKECEKWMQTIEERLNTTFSRSVFSIDEGERLLKQMQDMLEDISRYSAIVNSLIDRSKDILPLKQRRQPLPRPLRVNAVCNYSQGNMQIYKNEQCWLHDNSQKQRWKIINQKGAEGMVPGVVFAIPPPNPEAIDLAESLKRKYDQLIKLWTKKQHKLRLNMIFATINIVKGWDLKTFKAMEPSQRESIIRALNDDADKLLAEGDKNDPDMKRLRDEIKYINKLYQDLLRQLKEEEAENSPTSPARRFQETSTNLDQVLREKERVLIQRLNDPIPRDLDALDELHSQHKDFERDLGSYEATIAEMKVAFKQMAKKTPTQQDRHDKIVALWDKLWTLCRVYAERLKTVELAISSLKESTQAVSNVEISLASYENLPQDEEALRKIHEDLLAIQLEMQQQQPLFDQLVSNVTAAKKVTEKSRPNVYTHPDLRKLDDDAKKVLKRWSDAMNQIAERLRSCEAASEMLRAYRNKMDEEKQWANQMTIKVNTIKEVKSSRDAEREYQQALSLFTSLTERKPALEDLNLVGGRYIREAKIFDLRNKNYRDSLEDAHPSLDASLKQRSRALPGADGAEQVEKELDQANAEYRQIGEKLNQLLQSMQKYFTSEEQHKASMQERYRVSDESLTNLASWLSEVETRIANLGALHEDVNRLAHQQAVSKTVKEELEINRKVVNQALDQVRQISKEGAELLSASEISNLQRSAESVKSRYDNCNVNSDKLLRRIDTALEELQKFSNETRTFIDWLSASQRTLIEYEKYLSDVSNLRDNMDQFRQFSTDVISHQADLRFLTMAAQKFMDESKTYLRQLNEIRTAHPDRLGHIEAHESEVKGQVNEVTNAYQTLLTGVNRLSDQLGGLGERKRNYHEAVEKATVWLNDAQKQAKKLLEEPTGAEPRQIQDQLDRVRSFNMDIIQQGRLIDNARHSGESLIDMLPAGSPEKGQIQEKIKNLQDVYQQMVNLIGEKTNALQMALVHSQDIEDGLNRLLKWMDDVESQIKIQSRPASLIRERLDEQIHEHRVLTQEIESQRSVLEAMTQTAQQARLAKKVEQKLRDMHSRYEKVLDKLRKNGQILDEVSHQLDQFNGQCSRFEDWLSQLIDSIEEAGAARSAEEVQARLEDVIRRKNHKKSDFEEVMRAGRELTGRRDVTDTSIIKDRLRQLEQLWKEMDVRLTEQERTNRQRMEQLSAYEMLRAKVLEWLSTMENKIERLEPVSLDKDAIRKQAMEIKPLVKEHSDYKPTIDKVNELGRIYDSLVSEERSSSRMSIKSSPTRSEYTGQSNGHNGQQPWRGANGHSNGHGPASILGHRPSPPQPPGTHLLDSIDATPLLTPPQIQQSLQQQQQPPQHHQQQQQQQQPAAMLNYQNSSAAHKVAATQPKHDAANPAAHASLIKPDVSAVQQQLSEINHRYQIIGVKLSDRQRDLDGLADEVKRHHDTIKSLIAFVQTKERQMPKEVSPASKELADKQYSTLKEIQNDLADRQNEMDRVKIEVTDLLRRKPNAVGADSLQQSLQELVSKWSVLQAQIRDQLALLNDFRDFQDTHKLLDSWLNQKDKMFQVLGPIAHEPRMITAQMQQVHVMRDEFTSQEPLMRRMNQSGNEICSKLGSSNPAARKVKDGMDDIRNRWDELLGRLEKRERNLDAATGATQEFHQAINKLQDALQNISDNFDRLGEDGSDVFDQLRRLAGLEDDLEHQRPLLAEVESMCDHLCDILSDPASKSEIKSKFVAADRLYNNLNRKMNNRRAELESSLKEDREFGESLKQVQDWFDEIEHKLSADFRISADEHILRQQIERYEPVYREILDKEHEVHIMLSKGNEILQKMGRNKPEAQQLKSKMDNMRKGWEKIKREATERHTRLQTAMENCKRFYSAINKFGPWLQGTEAKFNELKPPSYHRAELDKQVREIQTFKNEMSRHAIDFDNVRSIGEVFLGCTDCDKEKVLDELENLQGRWDQLSKAIINRAQDLDDIAARLGEFNDKARDVAHTLQRMEDRAASHDDGARDARTLEKMRSLLREAQEFHKDLDRLRAYGESLINGAPIGCDTRHISDTMDDLERRHRDLTNKLEDKCHELDAAAGVMAQFNNKVKNIQTNFGHLEDEFNEFGPIGRDVRILNNQMTEVRTFKEKLHAAGDELEEAEHEARNIIAQGFTQDAKGLRTQLDNLKKQLSRLNEKASKRESGIESMLEKLQKFYDDLGDVQRGLSDASGEERNFRPVAADVETIRQQKEEFKHFRRSFIEPLGKAIEEINRAGQGLVQSAPAGVNTSQLENDVERLNSEWNQLKERLNERERTLDAALLHSGKFQEALTSVEKWLQETEEMVSNQKPPSADYKVVKAQLQEQKFLIRLIQDRESNMNSLMRMGEDVMKNVAPAERSNIQLTLEDIRDRYEKLQSGAKRRMEALERALPVAKSFQDKMAPLVDWLDHSEKKLTAMQTIPTDATRAAQRAQEHKNLHRDILDHKRDFEELTEIAQTLMGLVGDEEAQTVVDSLRELTDRYARLVEESERLEDMLQNAKEGIRAFSENYDELLGWMGEMERRLQRYQILSVYPEKLQQQLEELTELGEDIADHQRQVDQVVSAGQDMMRFATGDDAFNLKDRLDSLQARYNDLASKAAERVRQAQEALPIAQNFHQNHEKVSSWIDEADTVLKSVESAGLNAQESAIHRLEQDIPQVRNVIEVVNHLGPQLCQLSPGEGANVIESMMTRLNRRFDAICEQIQRKAERIELSKQRNSEVIGDLDELNDWFRDLEKQLQHAEPIIPDPDALSAMLKEHKAVCEDVSSQKGRVRDLLAAAKKLMRESTGEDQSLIRDKAESLKDISNRVSQLCADRLSALEQALPLAEHFFDTHAELVQWLEEMETEAELLGAPALNPAQIKKQQDKNKALLQSMNDHKPLLDKLNKTGAALIKLVPMEEGRKVQYIMNQDNQRYNDLRNLLKNQQQALEEAMQSTAQFADKLDGMLNALANTADQLNNAEPISAHVEKIQEQISDNNAIVDDLEKKSSALDAVRKAAKDVISKADGDEPAVQDIKKKLSKLNDLWDEIQGLASKRGRSLNDALSAAERFWDELNAVMRALKELQDNINAQEPPAVEPSAIQQQQEVLHEIREEIDNTKPEVDQCKQAGTDLMRLCGEPDKPEVKKHIEDLDQAWQNVMTLYAKREQSLADALSKAMGFHNTLQDLLEFLDSAEERFGKLGPIASDIATVKHQIADLKGFKDVVDPHMVQVEALNRQANELTERTTPDQARPIREALKEINKRWAALNKGIVDRQKELENALLRLGQFQHALNELLTWINKTDRQLDDVKVVVGDPQVIEVELAKHKVLMNDIQAHQSTVESLNKAGHQLIELDRSSRDAGETQTKLATLNARWQSLQDKANDKQRQLEAALREAQLFSQEIQDLLMWLSDVDQQLASSKPVGGLPETAREQLNRFMELYNEIDSNRHKVENTLSQGADFVRRSDGSATNLQHSLKTLKSRWDTVLQKANDRKIKLEIALREATEFHEALQQFVDWLTDSEKYLSNLKAVSRLLPSVLEQIEEHKNFQKDVSAHREVILNLDKKGTHLKYFSQKQDVILIKNLLVSVQHRWERVVSKAAERTRALDHGYKEAKEFHDSYEALDKWLTEAEHTIEDLANVGNDPDRIKRTLSKHKEFQRALAGKQATYDATMRAGRLLKDKAPKQDVPTLQKMLDDLKEKWNRICAKAVDKQRKLEEALLFSGQFKDAVQALIDWLDKSVPTLDPNEKVHGDLDTVNNLIEQHKQFQADLKNRQANLESVRKTSRELLRTASSEDAAHIRQQMSDLESKWENVMTLSNQKQRRLDDALRQAEQLHKSVHMLLEWLSDAEMKLRFAGPLPDDEAACRQQIAEHQRFMKEMEQQGHNKEKTIALAHEILQKCHPDAVSVIRHWITIIQSRWDEVSQWAKQRLQKLEDHLRGLRDILDLLEELMRWLLGAEATLTALEAQSLPDDIPTTEQLIDDHKIFMDDMSRRQPEVDRIAKAFTTKAAPQPATKTPVGRSSRGPHTRAGTPGRAGTPTKGAATEPAGTITNPRARELMDKWQSVWLMALERQKRLQDHLKYLRELEGIRNFDFDEWRRRFLAWLNSKKMRAMDAFRKIDKDNDGKVTKQDFIDGIIESRFPTSRLEMERVADIFDRNGDGYVDHKEYIDTLRPDRDNRPLTEDEKIQDEVQRQVAKCTCVHRFKVFQVGEGKYRFGDSQKLRLVRILRSTVMVRVGGGWVALEEFLVKNDPCRAKGRTNVELREQFILADGVSQSMAAFKSKGPGASSSFGKGPGGLPTQGPITKVREKTEKSIPLSTQRKLAAESESERSTPLGSRPRTSQSRLTPSLGGSRPSSRPASRANSDLSTESLEGFRRRTPSASSTTATRIPTRRTPSMTRQKSDLQAREKGWR